MKILVTRKWPTEVEDVLRTRGEVVFNAEDRPLDAAALASAAFDYDVICPTVTDRISSEILDRPNLRVRMICNYGAGYEHIDIEACRRAGMVVTNTPDVLTGATAEIAMLLMLTVARRAREGESELRSHGWTGWRPTHLLSTELNGKTLGLIGFGRIAQRTAELARAFGMKIIYHNRSRAADEIELSHGAEYCSDLTELLRRSDFVSIHCPGGPQTDGLINAARLSQMKPSAFLINTARGSVVDEAALIDALHKGVIAGAGLDVFRNEPRLSDGLFAAPNLVMLPHLGSATRETRVAMGMRALANLDQWLAGEKPRDRVA